jgi:hypothetical protein
MDYKWQGFYLGTIVTRYTVKIRSKISQDLKKNSITNWEDTNLENIKKAILLNDWKLCYKVLKNIYSYLKIELINC